MFEFLNKRKEEKTENERLKHCCKMIKPGIVTESMMEHVRYFIDKYNRKTGNHLTIESCEDKALTQSENEFDMPVSFCDKGIYYGILSWIKEYQSSPYVTGIPPEYDQHEKEILAGFESDDSYECLFEQIRDTSVQQNRQTIRLAFAVSPWSEEYETENTIKVFW